MNAVRLAPAMTPGEGRGSRDLILWRLCFAMEQQFRHVTNWLWKTSSMKRAAPELQAGRGRTWLAFR